MADGAATGAGLALAQRVRVDSSLHNPDEARARLLKASLTDAIAVGVSTFAISAFVAPFTGETLAIACLLGVAPFIVALATLGLGNVRVPYFIVGITTIGLVTLAFFVAAIGAQQRASLPLEIVGWLFGAALTPPFAALWASTKIRSEETRLPKLPCDAIGLVSVGTIAAISAMVVADQTAQTHALPAILATAAYLACLAPPATANWLQARRDRRIPVKRSDRQPDHISGLGASTFILFAIVVVTLGLWAAATGTQASISSYAGLIVLFGLLVAFGIVAFGLPQSKILSAAYAGLRNVAKPVGWLFSTVDSLLVFAVANALGANSLNPFLRFGLLLGMLLPCTFLGWYLPAPWGLIPLSLALLGSLSIARRWAWMEEDRENAMLARRFEGDHIRVGFSQDLKDEALVGFAVLFVIVPIALRQLHMAFDGRAFDINPSGDLDHLLAWLSFFGTEMAKAVPFVDWTEIYKVGGSSTINLNDSAIGVGQHIIFGMRILVDLVLLAAFLQAISITQRTKKLKEMFYVERSMNRLDPFIEPSEFRKLVRQTAAGFELKQAEFDAFPVYDPDRLEELKQRPDQDIAHVAAQLLDRDEQGGPEAQLSREARRSKPDFERCQSLLVELTEVPAFVLQVGPLKSAHYALNGKPAFLTVRSGLVEQIIRSPMSGAKINALSEILIGPGPGVQDPRKEVRRLALDALYLPAVEGNAAARGSIRRAATHDPSNWLRKLALDLLQHNPDW